MILGERLAHVYWLGGSPCSGKSTVTDILAARFRMSVYRCDDRYYDHIDRITQQGQPVFHRLSEAEPDDIWLRPVEQQISEEIELYAEEFPLILNDLLALPSEHPIIAEGAALMPDLLAPLGIRHDRMAWMIPTEQFQRTHYAQREWRHDVLQRCSDPAAAWENWMNRDAGFSRVVQRQATRNGNRLWITDGSRAIDEAVRQVETHYGLHHLPE